MFKICGSFLEVQCLMIVNEGVDSSLWSICSELIIEEGRTCHHLHLHLNIVGKMLPGGKKTQLPAVKLHGGCWLMLVDATTAVAPLQTN